ncbi:MAG: permease-like cell division protein FtsX [Xanthomonadales bacterium]|nr:permease-like cell division protein FtsX [Xanthomonadales bacterium]
MAAPLRRLRHKHRQARRGAWAQLRARPLAHGFAIALLALALLALLLLRAGLDQFRQLGEPLAGARTLNLFLAPAIDASGAQALVRELAADPRVAAVDTVSPQQGLAELGHVAGSAEALAALPDNPLPWLLTVEPVDRAAAAALAPEWRQRAEVELLADEHEWQQRADAVLRASRAVLLALAALVALAALLLAAGAVRTLRLEGAVERSLQRVFGASEADLRRPYLYLGLTYGFLAGLLAVALALALQLWLQPALAALYQAFGLTPATRPDPWLAAAPVLAALLGAAGAWLACLIEPDLEGGA